MKRIALVLMLLVLVCSFTVSAQQKKYALYSIAFYNQENLFDTIHDEGKRDFEYLPDGQMKWGTMKYMAKLKNMSEVLADISTDKLPMGPAAIGVSEIENLRVLNDLVKQPALAKRGYKIVFHEGPDRRGIDCALLYNPKLFKLMNSRLVECTYPNNDTTHLTRGFLIARGELAGESMSIIVNHWPSRFASSPARENTGRQVRAIKDSLLRIDPAMKIVIMGDMNDDPFDKSMAKALGAKREAKDCDAHDLYNPWWNLLVKKGIGTLCYHGKWNLFDQIVFTGNMLGKDYSTLKFYKNLVFMPEYLFQTSGKYKGYPKRTHAGGVWLNGYSDHLPTYIYLVKEVK